MDPVKAVGVKALRRQLSAGRDALRDRLAGQKDIRWLFIATFANSGSTALAKLLASAQGTITLKPNGEGQWLIPAMVGGGRWEREGNPDYALVRKVWLRKARLACAGAECLVIEKSPTNLARMPDLRRTFADMANRLICFTRDPYAVSASLLKRYGDKFQQERRDAGDIAGKLGDYAHLRELGARYGRRARIMAKLIPDADMALTYEHLTRDPASAIAALRQLDPLLAGLSSEVSVEVKDYAPQPLVDMNARQIATLSAMQIAAISDGLNEHRDAVEALGYSIRP